MTVFGISGARLALYGGAVTVLVALNVLRYAGDSGGEAPRALPSVGALPALPELTIAGDFDGFAGPAPRDLFRPASAVAPPPAPEPEPEPAPEPAPDPEARAISEALRTLDSVKVIGFISTADGVMAVLDIGGNVVNAFRGDRPLAGFTVQDVTIDSVTFLHRELELTRTIGLNDDD